MVYFLYILLCDQKTFYIGITNNLQKRFIQHQRKESPYTKKFSDIKMVYIEKYPMRTQAEKREKQLKKWSIAKKKALISKDKESLINLSKCS